MDKGVRMELSEEEKKAIKYLKRHIMPYENEDGNFEFLINDILLNLIIKQQNKIEAQEMEHQYDQKMIDDLKGEMVHNWLHKDKIRELLKSKDIELTGVISYRELEELL